MKKNVTIFRAMEATVYLQVLLKTQAALRPASFHIEFSAVKMGDRSRTLWGLQSHGDKHKGWADPHFAVFTSCPGCLPAF